jgi:hypothetical protein
MEQTVKSVTRDDAPEYAQALVERLLGLGGDRVVLQPAPEGEELLLVKRGIVFPGAGSKRIVGGRSRCHSNSAIQYFRFHNCQTGYKSCEIVTGYALSDDRIWRQHSWLWADGNVIETTVRRKLYFGMVLTASEALRFVFAEMSTVLPGFDEVKRTVAA